VLVIAGEDSSHAAGIDADREALTSGAGECVAVATAHTRQTDRALLELGARAPEQWVDEARTALTRDVAALKVGLLPGRAHVEAAAALLAEAAARIPVVVDPVVASSSGFVFLDSDALGAVRRALLPLPLYWTPNLPELAALTGCDPSSLVEPARRIEVGGKLLATGARGVLVKGGHAQEDPVRDLVLEPGREPHWNELPRLSGALRGTGCRYASTLALALAGGQPLAVAARTAQAYVAARIAQGARR